MKQFDADSPGRLDVVLAEHVGSRAKAARLIEAGLVTVDGSARPKSFAVERGMRIAVAPEPVPELDTRGGDAYAARAILLPANHHPSIPNHSGADHRSL